jgi:hypothetical protein
MGKRNNTLREIYMILAIDYDQTFSDFPEEFTELRKMFQKKGHTVYLVTARNEETEKIDKHDLSGFDKVVYTSGQAKSGFIRADIWIDDNPVTLCCDFVQGQPHAKPSKALHQGYKDKHILWNWEEDKFVSYVKKPFNAKKNDKKDN